MRVNTSKEHKNTAQWESCGSFLENAQLRPLQKKSFTNHKHERVQEISWTTGRTRTGKEKSLTKNTINQGQLQKVHMEEAPVHGTRSRTAGRREEKRGNSSIEGRSGRHARRAWWCGPIVAMLGHSPHAPTPKPRIAQFVQWRPVDGGDMLVIHHPTSHPTL